MSLIVGGNVVKTVTDLDYREYWSFNQDRLMCSLTMLGGEADDPLILDLKRVEDRINYVYSWLRIASVQPVTRHETPIDSSDDEIPDLVPT